MCGLRCLTRLLCVSMIVCQLQAENNVTRVLSRRKRFLIFPEGSSLQLVFCTTYPAIVSIGEILLWGNTAALAYELPQDPYSPFNHRADPLHRRMDTKTIYYTDINGKIIHKKPYKKKFMTNPAFAKRSVDKIFEEYKIDRKQMHTSRHGREFLKGGHFDNVDFHRSSRTRLYQQIEALLDGLGSDGRSCLLKTLCTMGQSQTSSQEGFLAEIIRAVFTLPKNHEMDDGNEEYDAAFSAKGSCEKLYPCS